MNIRSNGQESAPLILVVDDFEDNVKLLNSFLRAKGYNAHGTYDGQQALDFVAESPPDAILLDLVMPNVDGFEVCRRLKDDPKTRHIPVIIISGVMDKEANVRAIEAGADDFLIKPFDSVLLDARIRASLRSKRLQDQVLDYQETLERRIRERTAQLARAQSVAVFSLAKLAESRDTETGKHLERMRLYVREITLSLSQNDVHRHIINEAFIEELLQSAPLHDIGKVGIPDRVLLKPGRLNPVEWDIMKTHTTIGGDTLRAADLEAGQDSFLAMGRDIAYYHHEKWDGSGYPEGLKETDIPLPARIVAISDVYDALSSKRPYKEPFSHEKSMSIIVEGRGSHFDPAVVDAFVAREQEVVAIRESFKDPDEVSPIQRIHERLERMDAQGEEPDAQE